MVEICRGDGDEGAAVMKKDEVVPLPDAPMGAEIEKIMEDAQKELEELWKTFAIPENLMK